MLISYYFLKKSTTHLFSKFLFGKTGVFSQFKVGKSYLFIPDLLCMVLYDSIIDFVFPIFFSVHVRVRI